MSLQCCVTTLLLTTITCLPVSATPLLTGPDHLSDDLVHADSRTVTQDVLKLKEALGIALINDMYLNRPYIAPEKTVPAGGDPSKDARPAFSHVHSIFEAGQKGPLLDQRGVWIRHVNATMVLSYHDGCPIQLYRIVEDEESPHAEVLGSPLASPIFHPTSIIRPGELVTFESLCPDRATLVSFVTVPAWSPVLREELDPAKMAAEYPQHDQLIFRLASPGFNADRSPLFPTHEAGTDAS